MKEMNYTNNNMLRKFIRKIITLINVFMFRLFALFKLDDNLIILESEGDFSDNAFALFDYLKRNEYLKKYRVVWLVDDMERFRDYECENVSFCEKTTDRIDIRRARFLATSKWYIFDHNDMLSKLGKRKHQVIIYLCHAFPGYKAGKNPNDSRLKPVNYADYVVTYGELSASLINHYAEYPNAKILQLGFSRLDYFYSDLTLAKQIIEKTYNSSKYDKTLLWMPTFRRSVNVALSENYDKSETGLPLLNTEEDLYRFNEFLKSVNTLVFLKWHHLQSKLKIFDIKISNILFVSDSDIGSLGLQLYQFIPYADALITDYSSISADYMLLDKPIIYFLDDYEEYKKSRGIFPENALELMIGDHVYTYSQMEDAIKRICKGEDRYKDERREKLPMFHKYVDGMASKRIIDYFGI